MPETDNDYEFDPWELGTGLPDKITVRIVDPHFGTDAQINDGQTTLFIPAGTIIAGTEDGSAVDFAQFYSCGDGWEASGKGGARLVREDGRARKINNSSNYGKWLKSLQEAAEKQGLTDELRKRGNPFEASTFEGLEVFMERITQPTFIGRDGQPVSRDLLLVTEITGGMKKDASSGTVEPDAEKATVKGADSNGDGGAELDPKIKAKLRALARDCTTHAEFMEQGFEIDGVLNNTVAEDAVAADGPGSIWAEVKG